MTNWIILIVAGFFESCFAFCLGKMKGVVGLEYYFWGIGFLACLALSMILLAKAIQTIPIGTAYPVWTGIGAVGTVIVGIVFFHEPATFGRLFFVTTLIASIIDSGARNSSLFTSTLDGNVLHSSAISQSSAKEYLSSNSCLTD